MEKLLIIDGNSILNRAFYGVRPLTNSKGLQTNALFGMLSMLLKQMGEVKPDYAAIAFDLPEPTFRHKRYAEYKAGRKKMPDELFAQLPYSKILSEALGLTVLELPGYEADDLLGTVSRMAEEKGVESYIMTGDRDSLQLIGDSTFVLLASNSDTVKFDRAAFNEKYGIEPESFVDVKALMGDSSDNIPGVPGIGEKTALKLIADYKNLDTVYENLETAALGNSARQKMRDGRELAYLSYSLALIERHAPVDFTLESLKTDGMDRGKMYKLLAELEFTAQIKRLGLSSADVKEGGGVASPVSGSGDGVRAGEQLSFETAAFGTGSGTGKNSTVSEADKNREASGADKNSSVSEADKNGGLPGAEKSEGFGVAQSAESGEGGRVSDSVSGAAAVLFQGAKEVTLQETVKTEICLCDLSKIKGKTVAFAYDGERAAFTAEGETLVCACTDKAALAKAILENGLSLVLYDYKTFCTEFAGLSLDSVCGDDIMLAAYVINPSQSSYELSVLSDIYLQKSLEAGAAAYAETVYALNGIFAERLTAENQYSLYKNIELPLASVLSDMERSGFALDTGALTEFLAVLTETERDYASRIYMLAGVEFNINSPKQLGEVLFETLKLPAGKKNSRGYSTGAEVLEKLKNTHPIIQEILEYRAVAKLRSTYAEGLLKVVGADGRVHTSFNQTVTVTGRLSSTEPNLQNIPVRTELGREMRRFFVAKNEDYRLIDADYSQIELRILAHIAQDENMIAAFKSGEDIHSVTASEVFGVPLESVTPSMRKKAKAVNFGIVYGIGEFSLAGDLGVSRKEAGEYIKSYFARYTGIDAYLSGAVEAAKQLGYVETVFGRRRYIPELTSSKAVLRAFGERVAMNSPIQGSSADIIKLAMINARKALADEGLDARLILQVHDELIVEAHKDCAERAAEILRREMENVVSLKVPLTVELSIGNSWFECK